MLALSYNEAQLKKKQILVFILKKKRRNNTNEVVGSPCYFDKATRAAKILFIQHNNLILSFIYYANVFKYTALFIKYRNDPFFKGRKGWNFVEPEINPFLSFVICQRKFEFVHGFGFFLREIKNQRHEPLFYRGSNPKEEEFKMGISQKTITLGKKDQLLLATFPLSFFFLIEVLLWIKNVIIFFILFIKLI
jgi:hypothetical protein